MKTLKEFLVESHGTSDNDELFNWLEDYYDVVCKDDNDEHRWFTYYRVVTEVVIDGVKRYFSWYDVNLKNECETRDDIGWKVPDIETEVKEVFPKQITVTTYE